MLKKILFFTPSFAGGGAERTVIQLANALSNHTDYIVEIIVCDLEGKRGSLLPLVDKNINVINLDCKKVSKSILPLSKVLKNGNYDFLISTQTHTNIASMLAKKISGRAIKVILREVSTPSMNIKYQGFKLKLLKNTVKVLYKKAYKVVCVSNSAMEDFRVFYKYPNKNITAIYNPVIDDDYINLLNQPINHKFFKKNLKVVIGIGRLNEAKNFSLLINAFNTLYKEHPECRLIILGEGELRPQLETTILNLKLTEVVDLHGFTLNPFAFFKYCDLFVLSSNWEGLPGVLIQALASKIKIVSTDCPSGPSEILDKSKYGLLVERNDTNAMAEAMHAAIFGSYPQYDIQDLNKHCQQFEKESVINNYLKILI